MELPLNENFVGFSMLPNTFRMISNDSNETFDNLNRVLTSKFLIISAKFGVIFQLTSKSGKTKNQSNFVNFEMQLKLNYMLHTNFLFTGIFNQVA